MIEDKILLKIPEILNNDFLPDEAFGKIIEDIKIVFDCDFVAILYINDNGFEIKKISEYDTNLIKIITDHGSKKETKKFIQNQKPIVINSDGKTFTLLNEAGLHIKGVYSAMVLPMLIKSALFGGIVAVKAKPNVYNEKDLTRANVLASVFSYVIKDCELSDVFRLQVKILNEHVIEKSKSYEIIKMQHEQVKESERIKSEFIANMSHELRTPLNAIMGSSEALLLKLFGSLTTKQEEYLKDIYTSGTHLLGMINDLLDIAKIEAGAMKLSKRKFEAINSLKEVTSVVRGLAEEKGISIKLDVPKKDFEIIADEQKFHQIMYNLLSNAIKYNKENGKIEVILGKTSSKIKIAVRDNGIGIDPKYHGKIFGKFEQVDGSYTKRQSSTGLGLAITKDLVELHNGKIWLESKLNQGTIFTFELPLK